MSLYVVALTFPFTGTKGPSPNHEKQPQTITPPPPNRVQWRRALHHSSQLFALRILIFGLCAAARPWKPSSEAPKEQLLWWRCFQAVWNSVVSVYHATRFSTLQSRSVWSTTSWPSRCCSLTFPLHKNTTDSWSIAGQKFDELTGWKGGLLWWCHVESHSGLQEIEHTDMQSP
jgi:hypothetical protein